MAHAYRDLTARCAQLLLWLLLVGSATGAAAAQRYRVTDLGTLPDGTFSVAAGLNERGWTTGHAESNVSDGTYTAFIHKGLEIKPVNPFGGPYSEGRAINNRGWIAGFGERPDGREHAFLYNGQTSIDLGGLGGTTSAAWAINNKGWVVGQAQVAPTLGGKLHPFLYDGTSMKDLGTLGGIEGAAYDINDKGWVTGWSTTADGRRRAFIHDGVQIKDLGQLAASDRSYEGSDINKHGWVAGNAQDVNGLNRVFLHDGSQMHDLGTFRGYPTYAHAMNNKGWIVGWADRYSDGMVALLLRNGRKLDLNNHLDASGAGWILRQAWGINESGQIAGYGVHDGQGRGFLLTPVRDAAAPATQATMLAGLALVAVALRRRSWPLAGAKAPLEP
jgi:probable HAF family extracellular repeat protein